MCFTNEFGFDDCSDVCHTTLTSQHIWRVVKILTGMRTLSSQVGSQGSILPLILLTFDLSVKEDDTDFDIKFTGLWGCTDLLRNIIMMLGLLKETMSPI